MKLFTKSVLACAAIFAGVCASSCSDACDYTDTDTNNPSWISENYTDSTKIAHPDSLTNTKWVRAANMKVNAYGEQVQGFVEYINFTDPDSCQVMMSADTNVGATGTFTDDSCVFPNDTAKAKKDYKYEYAYSEITGKVEILKMVKDDKGKVSKTTIFTGIAVCGSKDVMTVAHYGDIPVQTYLVKQ